MTCQGSAVEGCFSPRPPQPDFTGELSPEEAGEYGRIRGRKEEAIGAAPPAWLSALYAVGVYAVRLGSVVLAS